MALPALTPEARAEALNKAIAARRARAALLAQLKTGQLDLADVLAREDDVTANTKVLHLLKGLPGVGDVRAQGLLTDLGISETRRVRGLGPIQRRRLLELFPSQR